MGVSLIPLGLNLINNSWADLFEAHLVSFLFGPFFGLKLRFQHSWREAQSVWILFLFFSSLWAGQAILSWACLLVLGVPNLGPNNAPIKSESFLDGFRLNVLPINSRASFFRLFAHVCHV